MIGEDSDISGQGELNLGVVRVAGFRYHWVLLNLPPNPVSN